MFCRDGGRQAIAHRARCRRSLRVEAAEAVEAMQPRRVIAGTVGEDRILGRVRLDVLHDRSHLHIARAGFRWCGPGQVSQRFSASGIPVAFFDGQQVIAVPALQSFFDDICHDQNRPLLCPPCP